MAHKNIYMALAAAQAEMGGAKKGADNPHFKSKYADLSEVVDAVKPALTSHGISVHSIMQSDEMGRAMVTILSHGESGSDIQCAIPLIIGKNDMQGLGSAITYARRYGLMCLAGIAPEDDDGNAAAASAPKQAPSNGGIIGAWKDAIDDGLPENATQKQKGRAYADAMISEIADKATAKSIGTKNDALENYMNARQRLLSWLGENMPDAHAEIMDAYLSRKNELLEAQAIESGDMVRAAE